MIVCATPIYCNPVIIEFFYRKGCSECNKVKTNVLPEIEQEKYGECRIERKSIDIQENYLQLVEYQELHGRTKNSPVNIVVNYSELLAGYEEIQRNMASAIQRAARAPLTERPPFGDNGDLLQKRVSKFTLMTILIAGFIDGLNPCVFSTMVFFMSLLLVARMDKKGLVIVGVTYCIACFITYFAIGFGIRQILGLLTGRVWMQMALEVLMVMILAIFALLSFADAFAYYRTRRAEKVRLQLPGKLKLKIHSVMKKGLQYKYLIPGIFSIGVLVTLLESVCTGQVYVPVLVFLTKEKIWGIWLIYLLLYNVMFILPLVFLFILVMKGAKSHKLLRWSKQNVVYSKILIGLFFIFLAVLMICAL